MAEIPPPQSRPAKTKKWPGLEVLWKALKKWRQIKLGPLALVYKFERAVVVTPNSTRRLRNACLKDRTFGAIAPADPLDAPAATGHFFEVRKDVQLALVVGVGPGLGFALARRLASEGMVVALASRNAERLDSLTHEIQDSGGMAVAYGCDATSEASVAELFSHVRSQHGTPHLVVYSVQGFGPGQVVDIELPAFEDAWKRNCLGAFLVAREAARAMVPFGRGTIVLTGSTSSLVGRAGHLNLAVGKFGQRALAQVMARELGPKGIHVAHLVIDADIDDGIEPPNGQPRSEPGHICESIMSLHRQPRTAWTSEADVRPWNEQFWEHC